jgi:hypothetical protein
MKLWPFTQFHRLIVVRHGLRSVWTWPVTIYTNAALLAVVNIPGNSQTGLSQHH